MKTFEEIVTELYFREKEMLEIINGINNSSSKKVRHKWIRSFNLMYQKIETLRFVLNMSCDIIEFDSLIKVK
jgi:hypothetical protein